MRNMLKRSVTAHYPDVEPDLPPRTRGVIALIDGGEAQAVAFTSEFHRGATTGPPPGR